MPPESVSSRSQSWTILKLMWTYFKSQNFIDDWDTIMFEIAAKIFMEPCTLKLLSRIIVPK